MKIYDIILSYSFSVVTDKSIQYDQKALNMP